MTDHLPSYLLVHVIHLHSKCLHHWSLLLKTSLSDTTRVSYYILDHARYENSLYEHANWGLIACKWLSHLQNQDQEMNKNHMRIIFYFILKIL